LTEVTGTWGTAVTFCQTARRNIPEGWSHLPIRRRENLNQKLQLLGHSFSFVPTDQVNHPAYSLGKSCDCYPTTATKVEL
jgi:hypothetical protein